MKELPNDPSDITRGDHVFFLFFIPFVSAFFLPSHITFQSSPFICSDIFFFLFLPPSLSFIHNRTSLTELLPFIYPICPTVISPPNVLVTAEERSVFSIS
ncbi:hypothetical protein B7P43_G07177 [Cryptotermes secundus]|uniref:Uncharacterized protein n=1 Tax=Cryptotermes secundus TaxID=105785 RepID=A0A2J7PJJ1_9NEOP|nr:hypothetical protein B7P43_G07177 [Cryptotermes secundus]